MSLFHTGLAFQSPFVRMQNRVCKDIVLFSMVCCLEGGEVKVDNNLMGMENGAIWTLKCCVTSFFYTLGLPYFHFDVECEQGD